MADKKLLDEDGVSQFAEETKKYVDKHANNADIHVTTVDKANWNGKQDALTAEQLAAVNSGINATAKGNYDAHIANADIHVTTVDKANWNGKQDALTAEQLAAVNSGINATAKGNYDAHIANADIHVTAADKANWNAKANDADVVHKSGNETVNGTKTFTVGPVSSNGATTNGFFIKNTAIARNDVPTTIYHSTFRVNDKNNQILGEYCVEKSNSGSSLLNMNVRTDDSDGNQVVESLYLNLASDGGTVNFHPGKNNRISLGTSSLKWKDVNTVLLNGKTPAYADDLSAVATSGSYNDLSDKPTIPTVNNATLTIQKNGTTVETFTANASSNVTANIVVPTKTSELTNDSGFLTTHNPVDSALSSTSTNAVQNKVINTALNAKANASDLEDYLPKTTTLESLSTNSIPFHNAYPRCKYLGTSITDAQNTAIKNRTYDDLFIGDYWTINGVNWRIVAIDYYYNVCDTNFDKGNIIVMPDTVLYNAQMNSTNTTAGAYHGSLMRTQNLNNARTIARNAFGSHLANHRILLANSVDGSGPNNWAWYDSDGVELPNEVQIYGTRVWGSALKGFDVATQKQQFPLMAIAPQFVNTRQTYWLQDVPSASVSGGFADVYDGGVAGISDASYSGGVRPSLTLSYI